MDHYEMPQVRAHLERGPLRRRLVLSGPADDFQRGELVQILDDIPGVQGVRWSSQQASFKAPLIVEGCAAALVGFLAGLVLAYLVELRRRATAEWRW